MIDAVNIGDRASFLEKFAKEASLLLRHRGRRDLGIWADETLFEQRVHLRPIDFERASDRFRLSVVLKSAAASPPAEVRHEDWHFTFRRDAIASLEIRNAPDFGVHPAVAAYMRAVNTLNLEALIACFKEDALVNDQSRDYWGHSQILEWAQSDVISYGMAIHVVGVKEHYRHWVVTARIWGSFDQEAVSMPLVLTFYFYPDDEKIAELIILQNDRDL